MNDDREASVRADLSGLTGLHRLSSDSVVTVEGITGIFTPLAGLDPKNPDGAANLQKLVDSLRAELERLRQENAALTAKVAELSAPPRSSDDFAAGVQHALDSLQSRLSEMDNPTSDFAVREFTLESRVHLEVSALGTIGMRFVQPDETVNAAALSTVSMTVVPMPKPADGTPTPASVQGIESIDGLTKEQITMLRANNVVTTRDFYSAATRATTTATLVSMLGVGRDQLGRMVLLAGLLTVPGVDKDSASLLFDAGIQDPATLAESSADSVLRGLKSVARKRRMKASSLPSAAAVGGWIGAAQAIRGQGSKE
jgi:hypothetical protein